MDTCFLESSINKKDKKFKSLILVRDNSLYEWSIKSRNGNRYHIPTTLKVLEETINKNKGIPVIVNHQVDKAIPVGRVLKVWEDEKGIWVEGIIDSNEKDIIEKIEKGILVNVSIHVLPGEESYQDESGVWWVYPKDILEISLVGINGIPGAVIELIESYIKKEGMMPNIINIKKLIKIAEESKTVEDFISKIPNKLVNDYGYCAWIGAVAKYFWPETKLFIIPTKRGGHVILFNNGKFIDTFNKLTHREIVKLLEKGIELKNFDENTLKVMLEQIDKLKENNEKFHDKNTENFIERLLRYSFLLE